MSGRILLIEDEELVGTMVRMNLESAGYEVVWWKEGPSGLAAAQQGEYDIILLDISLPGMDGLEILKVLRKQGNKVAVMMLTAQGNVTTKVKALEVGADDYLPKPFDVAELAARVNALMRRRS